MLPNYYKKCHIPLARSTFSGLPQPSCAHRREALAVDLGILEGMPDGSSSSNRGGSRPPIPAQLTVRARATSAFPRASVSCPRKERHSQWPVPQMVTWITSFVVSWTKPLLHDFLDVHPTAGGAYEPTHATKSARKVEETTLGLQSSLRKAWRIIFALNISKEGLEKRLSSFSFAFSFSGWKHRNFLSWVQDEVDIF